ALRHRGDGEDAAARASDRSLGLQLEYVGARPMEAFKRWDGEAQPHCGVAHRGGPQAGRGGGVEMSCRGAYDECYLSIAADADKGEPEAELLSPAAMVEG